MKKIILIVLIILITGSITVSAQDSYVFKTGISMIDNVPKQFFGTWQVASKILETNSPKTFSSNGADMWNLRRSGNVIELRNPLTGAVAEIYLNDVNNNNITFTHTQKEKFITLTDTVSLKLNGNTFTGVNNLKLEVKKEENNRLITETKTATYQIKGTKVLGTSIF